MKKNFFFLKKKVEKLTNAAKKSGKKGPKTIIKPLFFSVQVRVLSGYRFSVFFGLFSFG